MALTTAQLEARKQGVGSSDCATAIGINPYRTRYELFLEKTGQLAPEDLDEVERIKWGNILEDPIAREYAERTGQRIQRVNVTQVHREHDFLLSHIDRKIVGQRKLLEVKNVGHFYGAKAFGEEFTDDVPEVYLVQIMHQLLVNDYDEGDLAALIGGNKLKIFRVRFDEELAELILKKCTEFWSYVMRRETPPPQNVAELELMYAEDDGSIKTVDTAVFELWQRYHELKAVHDQAAGEFEKAKDALKFAIAEAAGIQLDNQLAGPETPAIEYAGKPLATWKAQSRTTLDSARLKKDHPEIFAEYARETRFRVLRVKN